MPAKELILRDFHLWDEAIRIAADALLHSLESHSKYRVINYPREVAVSVRMESESAETVVTYMFD